MFQANASFGSPSQGQIRPLPQSHLTNLFSEPTRPPSVASWADAGEEMKNTPQPRQEPRGYPTRPQTPVVQTARVDGDQHRAEVRPVESRATPSSFPDPLAYRHEDEIPYDYYQPKMQADNRQRQQYDKQGYEDQRYQPGDDQRYRRDEQRRDNYRDRRDDRRTRDRQPLRGRGGFQRRPPRDQRSVLPEIQVGMTDYRSLDQARLTQQVAFCERGFQRAGFNVRIALVANGWPLPHGDGSSITRYLTQVVSAPECKIHPSHQPLLASQGDSHFLFDKDPIALLSRELVIKDGKITGKVNLKPFTSRRVAHSESVRPHVGKDAYIHWLQKRKGQAIEPSTQEKSVFRNLDNTLDHLNTQEEKTWFVRAVVAYARYCTEGVDLRGNSADVITLIFFSSKAQTPIDWSKFKAPLDQQQMDEYYTSIGSPPIAFYCGEERLYFADDLSTLESGSYILKRGFGNRMHARTGEDIKFDGNMYSFKDGYIFRAAVRFFREGNNATPASDGTQRTVDVESMIFLLSQVSHEPKSSFTISIMTLLNAVSMMCFTEFTPFYGFEPVQTSYDLAYADLKNNFFGPANILCDGMFCAFSNYLDLQAGSTRQPICQPAAVARKPADEFDFSGFDP